MPTVLITGSNRGLGLEFVKQYAGAAWDVIATCREPNVATALNTLRANHHSIEIRKLEASDAGAIAELKTALGARPIDLLIHNAGLGQPPQPLGAIDYDLWQRMFQVHVIAPIRLTEPLLENVKLGKQKKVVAITSGLGSFAYLTENGFGFLGPLHPYRSTKAALNMALRGLAADVAPHGISVSRLESGLGTYRHGRSERAARAGRKHFQDASDDRESWPGELRIISGTRWHSHSVVGLLPPLASAGQARNQQIQSHPEWPETDPDGSEKTDRRP